MKRIIQVFLFVFICLLPVRAQKPVKIVFTPSGTSQTQFAGFYMAEELGFFSEEGLDVDIRHIGANSSEDIVQKLQSGEADFIVFQLLPSIIARSNGSDICNVMQITQHTAMMLVADRPVKSARDLDGLRIARWRQGYPELCKIISKPAGINVNWITSLGGINIFLFGAVNGTLCNSYNEYVKLQLSVGEINPDNVLNFREKGFDLPEDAVYVRSEYYKKYPETVEKFVRASKRGWEYVRSHRDEAVEVTMRQCAQNKIKTNRIFQKMMLDEYLDLQLGNSSSPDFSRLDKNKFDRMTTVLLESGIIFTKPEYEDLIK